MDVATAAMFLPRMNVERDFTNKTSQKTDLRPLVFYVFGMEM